MMLLKCVREWVWYFRNRKYFVKKNRLKRVPKGIRLRLPQYITCSSDADLGYDATLFVWDEFNGKKLKQTPQISIGLNFHATRNLTIQCASRISIGNDVLIASDVFIVDFNHGMDPTTKSYLDNDLALSNGVYIGDGTWIGNNSIILPGVSIGQKSIIGAGSVVTKDIPPYCIAVGNPAKVIKKFDFAKQKYMKV